MPALGLSTQVDCINSVGLVVILDLVVLICLHICAQWHSALLLDGYIP